MGHYYTKTGEPMYWLPKKTGTGNRSTTIKDARELGLLPSVTEVLKALDKPALTNWKIRQAVQAVVTAPDVPGENIDAKLVRVLEVERQQDQASDMAKDRGTEIHDVLEALVNGAKIDDIDRERVDVQKLDPIGPWVMPAYESLCLEQQPAHLIESVVVGDGYAGRVDLVQQTQDGYLWVDFKTSGSPLPIKGSWMDHRIQLAAYAATANGQPNRRTANLYISTKNRGEFIWSGNPPWQPDFECFMHLLAVWRHMNGFDA